MSSSSGPASAFGNLALAGDDEDDMPVTTRSAYRRSTQVSTNYPQETPLTSFASSRALRSSQQMSQPRPSRAQPVASSSSRRRRTAPAGDSSSSDDSDDEGGPSSNFHRVRAAIVLQIMAAFDPARQLSPREFATPSLNNEASRQTRRLAMAIAGLVQNQNDLNGLMTAAEFPSGFWARQLASNMELRTESIRRRLEENQRNPANGAGVVNTIASVRALFTEIDHIRDQYFARMSSTERRRFTSILVTALQWIVLNNDDLYANQPRPAYAGEGLQSERRLLTSFLSTNGQPLSFFETLRRFNGDLRHEATRLNSIYSMLYQYIAPVVQTMEEGPERSRINSVLHVVHQITQGLRASS